MKAFTSNWTVIFSALESWQSLSPGGRKLFIHQSPDGPSMHGEMLGEELQGLIDGGFLERAKHEPSQVKVPHQLKPLLRSMRFLQQHPLFNSHFSRVEFSGYARDLLTQAEIQSLVARSRPEEAGLGSLTNLATIQWLKTFLDESAAKQSSKAPQQHFWGWPSEPRADLPTITPLARQVVEELRERKEPIPMLELKALFPKVAPGFLGLAIQCGLNWVVLFAGLRASDLELMVGIWPGITRRLFRQTIPAPTAVQPQSKFHGAFLMDDMTAALVGCIEKPLRLRSDDGSLFTKSTEHIAARLLSLPKWMEECSNSESTGQDADDGYGSKYEEPDDEPRLVRVRDAVEKLRALSFLGGSAKGRWQPRQLEITADGYEWLKKSDQARLKVVMDRIVFDIKKKSARRVYDRSWKGFGGETRVVVKGVNHHIVELLSQSLFAANTDSFFSLKEFVHHHALENNPLLVWHRQKAKMSITHGWQEIPCLEENIEEIWADGLTGLLWDLLLPLGCIEMGLMNNQEISFRLREPGLYFLGQKKDFAYGQEISNAVVIQPNFDVVFLAPSVSAEAAISRFAERVGTGVGTLFRITKSSVTNAAAGGLKESEAINTLSRISTKALPANVHRQVQDWFGSCRFIKMRTVILVECPDTEAASRVIQAGRGTIRPLTPTLLEYTKPKEQAELIKKLKKNGVFVTKERGNTEECDENDTDIWR